MNGAENRPPRLLSRILRWLFPGPTGAEACDDLSREYAEIRGRHSGFTARLWYLSYLLRPCSWVLARELRRCQHRARGEAPPVVSARRYGVGVSWLDAKLGLRMLLKYPGLTIVSGLATSLTIAIGIGTFSFFQDFILRPIVPLHEGERIVSLGLRTTDTNRKDRHLLHDLAVWREEIGTIENVSAWRAAYRNLVSTDGRGGLIQVAMMTASGFEVARVPPLLGRPLLDADEIAGAPEVIVVGFDEWMTRFQGDPDVVGRTVQIGREVYTIVGVMPEGFTFPVSHSFWIPLRDDPDDYAVLEGPDGYFAFGRLAPGVTQEVAQAEITSIANRRAREFPDTHGHMRGQVMSYTDPHTGMDDVRAEDLFLVWIVLGMITLVLLIPFTNVAILVYARTAVRSGEIAIRNALGASRRRIVTQLFVEGLVLAGLSAAAGILVILFVLARVRLFMAIYLNTGMPFWAKNGQDPWTMAYAVGLTILAAVVAGMVPGLKATGRGVQANLNRSASGNGMRLGGIWTGLIVTQVAVTVAILPLAGSVGWEAIGAGLSRPTFAASEFLGAKISPEGASVLMEFSNGPRADSPEPIEEVVRRLEANSLVTGVTLSNEVPGESFLAGAWLEIEGLEPPPSVGAIRVGHTRVAEGFFDVLGVPISNGRALTGPDWESESYPVMVNQTFVRKILGNANPIGRRIRFYRRPGQEPLPWQEIVGVVDNLAENPLQPEKVLSRVFAPLYRGGIGMGIHLTVRVPSSPADFAPELQRIISSVDPTLRVSSLMPLGDLNDPVRTLLRVAGACIGLVLLSVLLLATAGVFSLISFNVTQRRREIGIRSALGGDPRRVLVSVLVRSMRQIGVGVVVGGLIVAAIPQIPIDTIVVERDLRLLFGLSVLMVVVGMLAAAGPARRGLRIPPTEALRGD